jgi:hypothetical protein
MFSINDHNKEKAVKGSIGVFQYLISKEGKPSNEQL